MDPILVTARPFIVLIQFCLTTENAFGLLLPDSRRPFLWKLFQRTKSNSYSKEAEKDAKLTTDQWIIKHKYPSEVHSVTTDDGYNLKIHRIPKPGHQPILLVHGLLASSSSFVTLGPTKSLAFLLSNENYDVWMANTRGNFYSKNHTTMTTSDSAFWKFSFHEIGMYDLPATIDLVRRETSFHEIVYIGHSQGATAFFVLCSMRPEYNDKIMLMHAFAPITYFGNTKVTPANVRKLKSFLKSQAKANKYELWPQGELKSDCLSDSKRRDECFTLATKYIGGDMENYNNSLDPILLSNLPSGGSIQQLRHYLQINKSDDFCSYDYGLDGNVEVYGGIEPILYNLSKITVPIILHYGLGDSIATPKDVHRFHKLLNSLAGLYSVPSGGFNHYDFLWSPDAHSLLYSRVMLITKDFIKGVLKYVID